MAIDGEARAGAAVVGTSLLAPRYLVTTLGAVSLVFLAAFEQLAVTTVMVTVTTELDGRSWYSVAFSIALASSVIGTVLGGLAADRRGPGAPLLAAVGVFGLGLLLAGLAPDIGTFVAARLLQGIGGGALTVTLYVLVAEVFDPVDRPRVFGAFAAAWVLPALIGPLLAGAVADTVGWRWVFLGVIAVAAGATALLLPALRTHGRRSEVAEREPDSGRRLALAVVVAASVVAIDLGGQAEDVLGALVAGLGVLVTLLALRPLLPVGTLRAARGLPAVIAMRGLMAAGFFLAEIYVPYLLQTRYDAKPWLAGLALTVGTIGWASGSQVQGRLGARLPDTTAFRVGTALVLVGVAGQLAIAALHVGPWAVPLLWVAGGAGMGLAYPRVSTAVLAASAEDERGRNSAAATMGDTVSSATWIALGGLAFTAIGGLGSDAAFPAAFGLATLAAAGATLVARRTA
ncbi:MFS transporter [Nocardioides sp. TRM66260-LWL]|uniref:MFS transporter n=1 Tax=Nocardioides sp. TRM66260-LWL TaxID=2874478 RepID=UPI001CC480D5|nr:MFS transporter [Nocardioides sp. TRM66260-LWL]MBZ5734763.1 MFS transporter [Nocardioides sp. TRM66260-LWL]